MTAPQTTNPLDALARQILTQGYVETPNGGKIGNLSEAFGWASIKPSDLATDTLDLAHHCGLSCPSAGLWVYTSADDQRTPEEIAAVQASLAAPASQPATPEPAAPVAEAPAPTPAPAPATGAPVAASASPVATAEHANRLEQWIAKIRAGATVLLHEIEDDLRKL